MYQIYQNDTYNSYDDKCYNIFRWILSNNINKPWDYAKSRSQSLNNIRWPCCPWIFGSIMRKLGEFVICSHKI
jgi:hypothetical protein